MAELLVAGTFEFVPLAETPVLVWVLARFAVSTSPNSCLLSLSAAVDGSVLLAVGLFGYESFSAISVRARFAVSIAPDMDPTRSPDVAAVVDVADVSAAVFI
ncbi:hypothetical protein ELS19_20100 [Halogeometricum borinquense]|uniref:Uncharacterized protein n=1 Tax=Halogeometricum borinquense TaxID=60847 RepID=A0A482T9V4_9EURY|nr:hypothetical protein [Halogeometricum borinquense]RYJ07733.1 hypothetical protein ELS19_20100 [Halogeometricum borinquense]